MSSPVATARHRGLSTEEARARLVQHGPNKLVDRERATWLKEAANLLLDPMAIMLVVAGAVYMLLGETRDAVLMFAALVPVIGVDVFLEARSRSALKKLARSVAPHARVVRDGREVSIDTAALVPGDLVVLAEGEFIHADGIVRSAANLAIDESSLTGESEPQIKRPVESSTASNRAPSDGRFFAGSTVLAGQGEGEIAATGRSTRFGEIARLVAAADTGQTPLQRRVGRLVKRLAVIAAAVAAAVVGLGLARGLGWGQALLGGISIAMSAAPEEFPLVFTLFLSVGAWRLTKHGVLVRRLASVETLGSTTVICTDKTGTLTKGEFVLDRLVPLAGSSERESPGSGGARFRGFTQRPHGASHPCAGCSPGAGCRPGHRRMAPGARPRLQSDRQAHVPRLVAGERGSRHPGRREGSARRDSRAREHDRRGTVHHRACAHAARVRRHPRPGGGRASGPRAERHRETRR